MDPVTTILKACEVGDIKRVKELIDSGVDVNCDGTGPTGIDLGYKFSPIEVASKNGKLDLVKYLVSKGADISSDGDYPVRIASLCGHIKIVKYLASKGANITVRNNEAIVNASIRGHIDIMKYLITVGATVPDDKTITEAFDEDYLYLIAADITALHDKTIEFARTHTQRKTIEYLADLVSTERCKYTLSLLLNKPRKIINNDILSILHRDKKKYPFYAKYKTK